MDIEVGLAGLVCPPGGAGMDNSDASVNSPRLGGVPVTCSTEWIGGGPREGVLTDCLTCRTGDKAVKGRRSWDHTFEGIVGGDPGRSEGGMLVDVGTETTSTPKA